MDMTKDIFLNEKKMKVIAIDLDGTLAKYEGWQGEEIIGSPIAGAVDFTHSLRVMGWTIIIFTTRYSTEIVRNWLVSHRFAWDLINENAYQLQTSGKIIADVYLDDRALNFGGEYDRRLLLKINKFKPYYLKKKGGE